VSEGALPPSSRVWGTGGWLPPEDREALDWLTLGRFLGWDVEICVVGHNGRLATPLPAHAHTIILACEPDLPDDDLVDQLVSRLARQSILVVSRAPRDGRPLQRIAAAFDSGEVLEAGAVDWRGPGPAQGLVFKNPIPVRRIAVHPDASIWASAANLPIVASRTCGLGVTVTLALHPSELRDANPAGTAVLKRLLTWSVPVATAWLDFENTLVLRMDDPGGAQNVYSRTWSYPKLGAAAWAAIGADLSARDARISLAYISGWVDDGDEQRGGLTIGGQPAQRRPGTVYPSPTVRYEDLAGHSPGTIHDYDAEFRGIQALRHAGVADVELHGYTHMHPDAEAWSRAPDRFESWPATAWFREFGRAAAATLESRAADDHPLTHALGFFERHFGIMPTTLICPGDQWTNATLERALALGLQLVGSYYLSIRHDGRFCWAQHVCAPYLDRPEATWFASELPTVGYFHDFEPAVHGVSWMTTWIDRWQEQGARRLIDFRELASALALRLSLTEDAGQLTLTVQRVDTPRAVRAIPIRIRARGALPSTLTVKLSDGESATLKIHSSADGTGIVFLPPDSL